MNNTPAATGWLWIRQGFLYFRQQPMELCALFLCYLFAMLVLELVPFVGQVLTFVCLPLFTLSFMQACRQLELGKRVHPRILLYGFHESRRKRMLQLGLLYLLAAGIALASSTLVDDGVFWQVISGQIELNEKTVQDSHLTRAMLFAMVIYIPALMSFWFAGPLIAWQQMPVFKAMFYSFFASLRTFRVLLMYALAWFAVGGILPTLLGMIVASISGNASLMFVIMMPLSMLSTTILYCSFYPSYVTIFGQPTDETTVSSTIS